MALYLPDQTVILICWYMHVFKERLIASDTEK